MSASVDWLSGPRPPLPRREKTPLYDQALAAAARVLSDLEQRESTAVLYRVAELDRVLEPEWPAVEPEDDGTVPAMPRVEVRRWSWRGVKARMSWQRRVAGGMSGLVLLATLYGWWNQ